MHNDGNTMINANIVIKVISNRWHEKDLPDHMRKSWLVSGNLSTRTTRPLFQNSPYSHLPSSNDLPN